MMINKIKIILITLIVVMVSGCVSPPKKLPKIEVFPEMYNEKPRSLLIMPPINLSTAADAKDYYATTIEMPIAFKGYYTFPYELVSEILKQEGVYDTELVYDMPLDKFHEYFGADAVLFTKIVKWDINYVVVASYLTVSIEFEIKSTKTSKTLWESSGNVRIDLSGGDGGGSALGVLVSLISTAIQSAAADYTEYARQANYRFVSPIPVGPYHPLYLKDQQTLVCPEGAAPALHPNPYAPGGYIETCPIKVDE
jgi:hypothetical protein